MDRATKFKEAVKTALAMTIAYGVALALNWEKPMWAGFAVAVICVATAGQSLNKATMRMLGTVLALAVSLVLIAAFPQHRWWFMVALSIYMGVCTYLKGESRYQYFWYVSGFVTVVIALGAGPDPARAFHTAMLRAQETGLGILVYTLVSLRLWPRSSVGDFKAVTTELLSVHRRLCHAHLNHVDRRTSLEELQALREQEVQEQSTFDQLLPAVESESYEVWSLRRHWRRFRNLSVEFMETIERLNESLEETRELDLKRFLPDLDLFSKNLDERLEKTERMLAGESHQKAPRELDLSIDKDAVSTLSPFQKASLVVTRNQLRGIESITRPIFETVQKIKGFVSLGVQREEAGSEEARFSIDPDNLTAAIRVMAVLWLSYLVWIYTEVPGGTGFVIMAGSVGMVVATTPQVPVPASIIPGIAGIAIGGSIYMLIMPHLASFAGLGALIFAWTFVVCYTFAEPRQAPYRAIGLSGFAVMTTISNEQSYSFLSVANTGLMFVLVLILLTFTAYIPLSPRPEKTILRLLKRFFRSAEFMMSHLALDPSARPSFTESQKAVFYQRELRTIPAKLERWVHSIDHKKFPNNGPESTQALVLSIQGLAYRIEQLLLATARSLPADPDTSELVGDIEKWRKSIASSFEAWSQDLGVDADQDLKRGLKTWVEALETRIEETYRHANGKTIDENEAEHFYRLLAGFQGVSKAAVAYAAIARTIDWAQWHENMFL